MNNTVVDAQDIAHDVMRVKKEFSEFGLLHIPTLGFGRDLFRAGADKLGFTTDTARAVAAVMAMSKGGANWYAHSYGGVALAEGVRERLASGQGFPSGHTATFLAAANNQWATDRIMKQAGIDVRGYTGHWLDPVPNLVGLNTVNPFKILANVLFAPMLATPASVHTYPPVK